MWLVRAAGVDLDLDFPGLELGVAEYAEVSLRNGLVRLRKEHGAAHPEIREAFTRESHFRAFYFPKP